MAFNNFPEGPGFVGNIPRDGLLSNPAFRMNQLNSYAAELERDQRLYQMAMEYRMGSTREPASLMGLQLGEPAPPGVDVGVNRDRGRDRDRDHRDFRSRDDRDRGRDRDRRRQDSDRSRGGDWSQERESRGSRHRDRSPVKGYRNSFDTDSRTSGYDEDDDEYGMGDDGDRLSSGGSDRYRSRGSDRQDDKGGDKWVSNQPSRTIILRGLNQEIDEKIIGAELMMLGLPVKDIRLIRRQSGVSRGFAFVEFHNVADAQRWMEHTQGSLLLLNMYRASMAYSVTRDRGSGGRDGSNLQRNDWVCVKCLGHNFKRRDFCYNCNLPRKESEKSAKSSDGQDEIGTNPCNTLIFRGLDALTTEEGLVKCLTQAFRSVPLAPIKNVAVVRDDLNTSRGFGFVEFHSVSASTNVLDCLNKMEPPLEVDGKQLLINYAKNTFNTTMAYIQQQQAQNQYYDSNYYQGQYYDPTTGQYYDYSQYYAQQAGATVTGAEAKGTTSNSTNSTNSAAAVAQAAIQAAQAAKNYQKHAQQKAVEAPSHDTVTVNGVEYPVYPPPDTSTYQYEETSGYYYDPLTQLYYDANSQYYYNSVTGGYMYWDAEKSTYLPAPTGEESARGDGQEKKDSKEDKKDKEKVKIAKKIAKDMEKWAKSMNAQKEALKEGIKRPMLQPGSSAGNAGTLRQESATADAGYNILQKAKEDTSMMPPPPPAPKSEKSPASSSSVPGLVASYGGDSDSGGEEEDAVAPLDESKLVDWTKLACLLCKRQFQSKEILSKHTQVSDLHKQNLESLMKTKSAAAAGKIEYRDRAKERRLKYGAPEPPAPRERKRLEEDPEPVLFEQPTKEGIGGENIGSKLLQKMGWSQGQGLGKANQGRTDPVEARRRNQMSGLGARGANIAADVGDSYRDALKKTMFARYNEAD